MQAVFYFLNAFLCVVQRLHPNHEQPKNVYSKYDRGWVVYLKQAQGGGNPSLATQQFTHFIDACNNPLNRLAGLPSTPSTPVFPSGVGAAYPQPYTLTNPAAAGMTGGVGGGGNAHTAVIPTLRLMDPQSPSQQQQLSQSVARLTLSDRTATAAAAGAAGGGGGVSLPQEPQQYQYGYSGNSMFQHRYSGNAMFVAAAPPSPAPNAAAATAAAAGVSPAGTAAADYSNLYPWMDSGLRRSDSSEAGSVRIGAGAGGHSRSSGHDPLAAADGPLLYAEAGESDEDFARRLNSYYSSHSEQNPFLGLPGSRANSATAASGGSPTRAGAGGARPEGAATAALTAAATAAAAASGSPNNPFLGMPGVVPVGGFVGAMQPAVGGARATAAAVPPAAQMSDGEPSAPPLAPPAVAAPAAASGGVGVSPVVPPGVTAGVTGGSSGLVDDPQEADMCVICLSANREVGFLHGNSVHKCVCRECAGLIRLGAPCPMCRQPIERILGVF